MADLNYLPKLSADEKDLLESKTLWGAVIGGVGFALQHFNVSIDQAQWTSIAVELAGFAIVVYGRYQAHKPITSVLGLTFKKFADAEVAAMRSSQAIKAKATPPADTPASGTDA